MLHEVPRHAEDHAGDLARAHVREIVPLRDDLCISEHRELVIVRNSLVVLCLEVTEARHEILGVLCERCLTQRSLTIEFVGLVPVLELLDLAIYCHWFSLPLLEE